MSKMFIHAAEIADVLGKSRSYGYKIVRQLNQELRKKGFATVEGQTSRKYFYERYYGEISKEEVNTNARI